MKFDVIVGNPPYQRQVGPSKTEPLWHKFVNKAFELVKEGGHVCMVHPSGWRNVEGRFSKTKDLLNSKQVEYLEIHDSKDGAKIFGATTRYDWYVVKNIANVEEETLVKFQDGSEKSLNLNELGFIPNGEIENICKLIANKGEERVNVLYSCYYHAQNARVSPIKGDDFKYPLVRSISVKNIPAMVLYSNVRNDEQFGVPKVILTKLGEAAMVDKAGEYGMCEDCCAILDDVENLESIHKAVKSKPFIELMKMCNVGGQAGNIYNYKIIGMFKKDFWKDFTK